MPITNREGALLFATGIDNSGLLRDKEKSLGILKGFGGMISKLDIFAGLATGAALAFKKIAGEAYKMSKEFEHSMKEISTISADVTSDFDGYSNAIVNMSKEVPQSANELAKAYYEIVSSGYDGKKGLELLNVAAKAAVAGVTDVTTAADGMTTVFNAWGISTSRANEVADIFFQTVKLGKITFGEMAGSIAQVAPLAASMNVSFEEVSATLATLTKSGTSADEAMTQIRGALIALNEKLGQGWRDTYTLQEGFEEVAKRAAAAGGSVKEFIGDIRGAMGILGVTGAKAAMAAMDIKEMAKAFGISEEAFKRMVADNVNQTKILWNNIHAKMLPLGNAINKAVTDMTTRLNEAFKASAGKFEEQKEKYISLEKALKPLIEKYKELTGKTSLTNVEQEELRRIIENIGKLVPTAITEFGKYGTALDISAGKVENYLEKMKFLARYLNREAIAENDKTLKELEKQRDQAELYLKWGLDEKEFKLPSPTPIIPEIFKPGPTKDKTVEEKIAALKELDIKIDETKALIAVLNGEWEEGGKGIQGKYPEEKYPKGAGPTPPEQPVGKPFKLEDFQTELDAAKKAYQDYEKLLLAGFDKQAEEFYQSTLKMGTTWEEYLRNQIEKYKGNIEALKILFSDFADLQPEKITPIGIEDMLKTMQQEVEKRAVLIKVDYTKPERDLEEISNTFLGISDTLGAAGDLLGKFNDDLGITATEMGRIATGISQMVQGLSVGDMFSVITGALRVMQALTEVFDSIFDKSEAIAEEFKEYNEKVTQSTERINRMLENQQRIIEDMNEAKWLDTFNQRIVEWNDSLEITKKQIRDIAVYTSKPGFLSEKFTPVDTSGWGIEEWRKLLTEPSEFTFDEKSLDALFAQYDNFLDLIEESYKERARLLISTTAGSIADSIIDGLMDGKRGIEDFAGTFEDLMKQAILNAFKYQVITKQLEPWLKYLDEFAGDAEGLVAWEIEWLKGWANQIITRTGESWALTEEILGPLLGVTEETKGMAGAIKRGITEETAGIIEGQFNAVRIDVKAQLEAMYAAVDYLFEIA